MPLFSVVTFEAVLVKLLLIMNELRNTNEVGVDDMSNTRGLLYLGDCARPHHPLTWTDAMRSLPPHALGSWYYRQAAVTTTPVACQPHHTILSDRLRRFMQPRLAAFSAYMSTQPAPETLSVTSLRFQLQEALRFHVAEAKTSRATVESLMWSALESLCLDDHAFVYSLIETCLPGAEWTPSARYAIPRLQILFIDAYSELLRQSLYRNLQYYFRTSLKEPQKQGDWVSNNPGDLAKFWPRREGVQYFASIPMPTATYTTNELLGQGLSGIYLAEDVEGYFARGQVYPTNPLAKYKK